MRPAALAVRLPARSRRRALLAFLGAAALGAPAWAAGQAVRVTATDSATGGPALNALLTPLDTAGREGASAVTGPSGGRVLGVPAAGTYRVLVRRIGQRPFTSDPVAVGPRDTVALALRLPSRPATLASIRVTSRPACGRGGRAESPEVAALWEQVRTAVQLVALRDEADDSGEAPRVQRYTLRLDADARTVTRETVLPAAPGQARPFAGFAPESLARRGYVWHDRGAATYAVLDERALLSDEFAADHCFQAVVGAGAEAGLVGLSFAPRPSRRVPDVAGVLWADAPTSALRYLDFWYVDPKLDAAVRGPGKAGGEAHFGTLPNGTWALLAWAVRAPTFVGAPTFVAARAARQGPEGWRFIEAGAVVLGTEGGARAPTAALARLAARVRAGAAVVRVADAAGRPLGGALVSLEQIPDAAAAGYTIDGAGGAIRRARIRGADTTLAADAQGVATVAGLPPGRYLARAAHPTIEADGVEPPAVPFVVGPDGVAEVRVAPPALASIARRCDDRTARDTLRSLVVYGAVEDASAGDALYRREPPPASGARVAVRWGRGAGDERRRLRADDDGTFVVCGVPADGTPVVVAEAVGGGGAAAARVVAPGAWRAVYARLVLGGDAGAASDGSSDKPR